MKRIYNTKTNTNKKMKLKEKQDVIFNAVQFAKEFGVDKACEKYSLVHNTLSRIINSDHRNKKKNNMVETKQMYGDRIRFSNWCKKNGVTANDGFIFFDNLGKTLEIIDDCGKKVRVCEDIDYVKEDLGDLIPVGEVVKMIGMKDTRNFNFYVKARNIPFTLIRSKRYFDKNLDFKELTKRTR